MMFFFHFIYRNLYNYLMRKDGIFFLTLSKTDEQIVKRIKTKHR